MDRDTKIEELKTQLQKFCEERQWDPFHGPKDLAIGAVTESSELLEIFRFQNEDQADEILVNPATRQNVADELADVFFFVLRFAQKYDFDLSECFAAKMEKNRIKYPVEKSRGQNKKYTEL